MITLILLLIAFVWAVASVYYQLAVRPFAHDSVRFDIFAIRDELREKAIRREVDSQSFAFKHLESMLNKMVHLCGWYSVSSVIEFIVFHSHEAQSKDISRFDSEAPPMLKEMESRAMNRMLLVMAANSPGWVVVSGVIWIADALTKKHKTQRWVERENRVIWHGNGSLTPA